MRLWGRGSTVLAQRVALALGCGALVVAVAGLEPDVVTAFQARGGAAVSGLVLEAFLWWRWIERRDRVQEGHERSPARVLVAVPVVFVASMIAVNVHPVHTWSESLDAFRTAVNASDGVVDVADALPADRRAVVWGWTASSLSLLLRGDAGAGILVDRDPSIVPFPPAEARAQIEDEYTWGG